MTGSDNAIQIEGLDKSFGSFQALRDLTLTVERGEVHGFLGPNGAGKSTTIRVLLGLLRADRGSVHLLGGDPWTDVVSLHRRLAYVPGDVSLWPSMTGGEAIDLLGGLRGGLNEARREELVERFELDPTKRGRQYSKGNRQKVAIIAALASDVELLIMDEPTSGLDPLMEHVFQEVVGDAVKRGTTILLSSHIMTEVEALADRLSIIRNGTIIQTSTLADLRRRTQSTIRMTLERVPHVDELRVLLHGVHVDGARVSGTIDADRVGDVVSQLTAYGLQDLTVEPPSLESLFLRFYQGDEAAIPSIPGDGALA